MDIVKPREPFSPDWRHVEAAARNREARRLPLYEHIICHGVMEAVLNQPVAGLFRGSDDDLREGLARTCRFFRTVGYDTVSFECCITDILPGGGALGRHVQGVIRDRADFERYPWDRIPDLFFETFSRHFDALESVLPEGMAAVGGPGNGLFECAEDLVGYMDLCYLAADDPELYEDLFRTLARVHTAIWSRFLSRYGHLYCVCRFGDDLGFRTSTLISAEDIRRLVIPGYRQVIDRIHQAGKPFLLHSCGCIFDVMEDLIAAGIDAKHSNEDQIAPFPVWVERYGDRIGNFGGIDTDAVCRLARAEMREYIHDVLARCAGHGGIAFGSGNSIPDYVPVEGFLAMTEIVREYRGE